MSRLAVADTDILHNDGLSMMARRYDWLATTRADSQRWALHNDGLFATVRNPQRAVTYNEQSCTMTASPQRRAFHNHGRFTTRADSQRRAVRNGTPFTTTATSQPRPLHNHGQFTTTALAEKLIREHKNELSAPLACQRERGAGWVGGSNLG